MRLKSLYVATAVAMAAVLALSFLAFQAIANRVQKLKINPVFDRMDDVQLEDAHEAYKAGGAAGLRLYLLRVDRIFGGSHYLLDSDGRDLVTGESRSALLPPPGITHSRTQAHGQWVVTHQSQDGQLWFAGVGPTSPLHVWTFLPYYFLVIAATGALCWAAAAGVVSPIRRVGATIARFGQGELSVRVTSNRPDEIGQLGRSFNQMAERLERLIVSERRLLGDISHELRSPLARLKFAVKLARTSQDSGAALDRIERDVDRITSLVSDIVEITFLEGDPALQGAVPVHLSTIVDEVVRDCALEAQMRHCRILQDGAVAGHVMGNPELLRRAVENVVRNAIRYSPEKGTIQVVLGEVGREATVTVRDQGPGVPQEALERIFDPFYRVEESRTANGGGSGLGLSIAKRAVQVHHGTICAQNAEPGLRVKIRIPLHSERGTH